jgi:hypothetical protein
MAVNFASGLWLACRLRSIVNIAGTDVTRDDSGNNRHPVKVGSPTVSEANGFSGGSSANYFSLNSFITSLNGLTAYTLNCKVKGTTRAVNKTAVSVGGASAATTVNVYPHDNSGTALYANGAIRYPGVSNLVPVNDGNWHDITFAAVSATENHLYLDGAEVLPFSAANCGLPNPCTGGAIGCWHVGPAQSYGDQIKDVLIFTRAVSAGEVAGLVAGEWPSAGTKRMLMGVGG